MSATQSSASGPPQAREVARCVLCQAQMTVQHVVPARPGFEHWTLRCTKCGLIQEAQVHADPTLSDALRCIGSNELVPPK